MALRGVGIDVADVDRFARLLQSSGERFTRRWFSPDEASECANAARPAAALAARFAAKEAVWKAIGISDHPGIPWRAIEIVGSPEGHRAEVVLNGPLNERATRAGVGAVHVEWSISGTLAVAIALAEHRSPR